MEKIMRQLDPTFTLSQADSRVANVQVGDYTYAADGAPDLIAYLPTDIIIIGKFCSLANGAIVFGGGEHNLSWATQYPMRIAFGMEGAGTDGHPTSKGPTIVGNDVYIGYNAIVLSGVKVGHGAIIGAGSVVTQNVPDYAIVGGNPARVIKMRMTDAQTADMLKIRWWDWPIEEIKKAIPYLCSDSIQGFIDRYKT
jgi:acetyltransferase-like isoleucine patch superfamily enzyme